MSRGLIATLVIAIGAVAVCVSPGESAGLADTQMTQPATYVGRLMITDRAAFLVQVNADARRAAPTPLYFGLLLERLLADSRESPNRQGAAVTRSILRNSCQLRSGMPVEIRARVKEYQGERLLVVSEIEGCNL